MKTLKSKFCIMACMSLLLVLLNTGRAEAPTYTRLAVVPFENQTGKTDLAWVGGGISDTLTTELRTMRELIIIERAQLAEVMKEQRLAQTGHVDEKTAVQTGKLLSAHFLLLGSYQVLAEEVVINARLVKVETGETKEATRVRGKFGSIFDLQDDIAKKALEWLKLTPTQAEIRQMTAAPDRNISTFEYISRFRDAFFAGRTDEAEKWLNKALEADPSSPDAIMEKGRLQARKGDYDGAYSSFSKAGELYRKKNDEKNYARTLNLAADLMNRQGKYKEALKNQNQSLEISKRIGDEQGTAEAINEIGVSYFYLGRYDDAMKNFNESLKTKKKLNDELGMEETINNIGAIHDAQGRYEEALKYYNQSLEIGKKIGDQAGVSTILNNIGLEYYSLKKYDEALKYYGQSLELARKMGYESQVALSLLHMGNTYRTRGRFNEALKMFQQSLVVRRKLGEELGIAECLIGIGVCHQMMGDFAEARTAWEEAVTHYEKIGDHKDAQKLRQKIKELP